jgi:hypothetical protein
MVNIENTEFEVLLKKYDFVLEKIATKKKKNSELIKLDYFYNNILPKSIDKKGYITLNELSNIMRYKLIRGKMRPLQKLVDSNDEKVVISTSIEAIKLFKEDNWEGGLKILQNNLKGVGVATASYIGVLIRPDLCPIMSDEAIKYSLKLGTKDKIPGYTMKIYKIVQSTLFEKANFLNNNINNSNNSNNKINWNAEMIGKAIWVKYNE